MSLRPRATRRPTGPQTPTPTSTPIGTPDLVQRSTSPSRRGGFVRIMPLPSTEEDEDTERRAAAGRDVDARLSAVAAAALRGEEGHEGAAEEVMARLREAVAEKVAGERWRFEGVADDGEGV